MSRPPSIWNSLFLLPSLQSPASSNNLLDTRITFLHLLFLSFLSFSIISQLFFFIHVRFLFLSVYVDILCHTLYSIPAENITRCHFQVLSAFSVPLLRCKEEFTFFPSIKSNYLFYIPKGTHGGTI